MDPLPDQAGWQKAAAAVTANGNLVFDPMDTVARRDPREIQIAAVVGAPGEPLALAHFTGRPSCVDGASVRREPIPRGMWVPIPPRLFLHLRMHAGKVVWVYVRESPRSRKARRGSPRRIHFAPYRPNP